MLTCINELNSFDNFYEIAKNLLPKQKGDLFEEFTKYIFKYHPNYRYFTKEVWLLNEVPLSILTKLNMPTKDMGIDLILIDKYNKLHAIQCKFRMNIDEIITWNELATFYGLTFGVAKGFKGGFYVTNTLEITEIAKKSNRIIPLFGDFFSNITNDFFNELKSILIPTIKFTPIIFKPRKYQSEMIRDSIMHFCDHDRGLIESACGTGKTLTTYWINKNLFYNLTIVAVPSLFLLSQFYKDWVKQMILEKIKADFILVGSDADCDNVKFENNGLIITTNTREIVNTIKNVICDKGGNGHQYRKLIIITTYQSSDKLIDALKICKVEPDLCIFDEAHKTVGQTNTQFSLLLNDKNIKIKKRLFVTATPKIFNGNIEDENILSMDDENWYGKKIYTYNTSDAIKDGYLTDYQIVTMYTDNDYIQNMITQNKYVWYDKTLIDSQYMATAIMLLNEFKKKDCTHLVTYHNSVAGSKKFKELLEKLVENGDLKITILAVDGNHSMKIRTRIFKEFTNNNLAILVSARVLNEGVNLPIIDSVCFVDPRTSIIDVIQSLGRSLRLYNGKLFAKIYVPIVVEDIMDMNENKLFGNLIRMLKCLSETDNNIKDYFDAIKNGKICDRKLIRHDNCLSVEKIGENINVDEWMNGIDVNIWKKVDSWEYNYNELKQWVVVNKRIPEQKSKDKTEKRLGIFCNHQRQYKKNGILDNDKIQKLENISEWYWNLEDSFNETYSKLKQWIENNKKLPSHGSKGEIEKKLGQFCHNQRTNKKNNNLDNNRIQKLNEISLWYWGNDKIKIIKTFDESYDELKHWVAINKKIPSRTSKNEIEKKLGEFCSSQRKNKKFGKLNNDRIYKLNEISLWYWGNDEIKIIKTFDDTYDELKQWVVINKKMPNQHSKNEIEKKLGHFCCNQRQNKKNGNLNNDRIKKLEELNGWYWTAK